MANTYDVQETTRDNDSNTSQDDKGYVTFTAKRSWTIVLDSVNSNDNAVSVRQACQSLGELPIEGQAHPNSNIMFCNGVSVKPVGSSPIYYSASATYKSPKLDPENDNENQIPIDLTTKVSWKSSKSVEPIDEDFEGNALKNIGTDEPIQGITRRVSDIVAVLEKNFLTFDPRAIRAYIHTTNSDSFLGFNPGEGFVDSVSADPAIQNNILYYVVRAEIIFREPYRTSSANAWHKRVLHQGFKEVIDNDGTDEVIPANNGLGGDSTEPVLLDSEGARLDVGATPHWQEFRIYGQTVFSTMGF